MQPLAVTDLARFVAAQSGGGRPQLLDVREPWEVALGAIELPGADVLAIPMNSIPARLSEIDPQRPIVCICHHGVRSAHVAAFLERHHCSAVYNLDGGTDAWSAQVDPRLPRY